MKPMLALLTAIAMTVVFVAAPAAAGTALVYEPFDYPGTNQNINNQDGGVGFDGAWIASGFGGNNFETGRTSFNVGSGTTVNEVGGLEFPGLATAGSGLARFGTAGQRHAYRLLSSAAQEALTEDNTTIWFSILLGSPNNNRFGTFIFGDTELFAGGSFPNGNMNGAGQGFGVGFRTDNDGVAVGGSGSANAVAFINSDSATVDVGSFVPVLQSGGTHHDTMLIVGKIIWNPDGTPDELFLFNITDVSMGEPDEEDAIASLTADLDQSTFDRISFWDTGTSIFDEVRIGTSFASVVPESELAIVALSPENDATGVYPGIGELSATFSETVQLTDEGTVTLKNLTAGTEEVIELPDAAVAAVDDDLVIDLAANLAFGTQYAVRISSDAIDRFAGIDDDDTWTFTTAEQNLNPPVITVKSPSHEATDVALDTSIVATFDQVLLLGTGDIVIKDLDDDSTTQTIAVTDASQVTLADNVLTIQPATPLAVAREYAVLIDSAVVRNFSDVDFAGITDDSEWTFSTLEIGNIASQLGILDLVANSGNNPATGELWQPGDSYRLVFISSDPLDPRDDTAPSPFGSWNNIDTWNAEAQNFADTAEGQDLSGVTWRVIGSTTSVNARDNTRTNPAEDGNGHAIMLIDGKTIVANDFNGLWGSSGHSIQNVIRFTQNIVGGENEHILDAPAIWWPFTGTNVSGANQGAGGSLRDIGPGGAIRQGQGDNTQGWIDRANFTVAASSSSPQAIYVMSERLFVIDLDDDVAPEFISFANDVGGSPIEFPGDSVVYTVTFSEAMLPQTVTADVFENAQATSIAIDDILQLEDAAVFEVTVTPMGAGSIQLQIKEGAVITDLNGNPLDTTDAITDVTVITVDARPPELVSIVDDQAGGPVEAGTPVTYTLTFDIPMDLTTFGAADFGNAGTSDIAIGAISEVTGTVFTVAVTPTTAGTLQFQINEGAELKDIYGTALDTSAAIVDETVITVEEPTDAYGIWSGGQGFDADTSGDGIPNGVAWVLGADNPTINVRDEGLLPTIEADGDLVTFVFRRLREANEDPDTEIEAEYSTDLAGWTDAVAGVGIAIDVDDTDPNVDIVTVTFDKSELGIDDRLFVRLRVAQIGEE